MVEESGFFPKLPVSGIGRKKRVFSPPSKVSEPEEKSQFFRFVPKVEEKVPP
ncbi:MAG: hypothetical protein IJ111_13580 [Eggerthellaceae bacterium]|nr:hypothetical protein [Eggerthellaceae bacterium]